VSEACRLDAGFASRVVSRKDCAEGTRSGTQRRRKLFATIRVTFALDGDIDASWHANRNRLRPIDAPLGAFT
jgi:hypothetical protein